MPQKTETGTVWARGRGWERGNVKFVGALTQIGSLVAPPSDAATARSIVADPTADRIVGAATPSAQLPCC